MKPKFLLIKLGVCLLAGLLAAATAGGFPTGSRSGPSDGPRGARTFKYSIGATNLVFTLLPDGLVVEEPAFARSGIIPTRGGRVDEARLVDFLRAFGIEDVRIRERLPAIKERIRDNLGLLVAGRGSFPAGSDRDLEPAGRGPGRTGGGSRGRSGGAKTRGGAGDSETDREQEPELDSDSPGRGADHAESLASLIDRGVRLGGSLHGENAASRVFQEAGERLRAAQDVMTRSQAFLNGAGRDPVRGLALKEELASSRSSLQDSIQDLGDLMDGIRDNRQDLQDSGEGLDQKTNQLVSILATVLKTEREAESAVSRNLN